MKIVSKFKIGDTTYVIYKLSGGALIISPCFISDYIENVFNKIEGGDYDGKDS